MDVLPDANRPETCALVGLDCRTCIQKAAATVARVCSGLAPSGAQEIFYQLYPSPGCTPMVSAFEAVYLEATQAAPANRAAVAAAA